jgi:TonB family protein
MVANAGTTLQVAQTDERLTIDEASNATAVPYSAATKAPRRRSCPQLEVPESVIQAELEGTVKVVLDIGAEGSVTAVRVVSGLTPEADSACIAMFRGCSFRPGQQGDSPIAVTNLPQRCRFKAIE